MGNFITTWVTVFMHFNGPTNIFTFNFSMSVVAICYCFLWEADRAGWSMPHHAAACRRTCLNRRPLLRFRRHQYRKKLLLFTEPFTDLLYPSAPDGKINNFSSQTPAGIRPSLISFEDLTDNSHGENISQIWAWHPYKLLPDLSGTICRH